MKGKIRITIDDRLKFNRNYTSVNERKEIMGQYLLQYQGHKIEFIIQPKIQDNSKMTDFEKEKICRFFRLNLSQSEIARRLKISRHLVSNVLSEKL